MAVPNGSCSARLAVLVAVPLRLFYQWHAVSATVRDPGCQSLWSFLTRVTASACAHAHMQLEQPEVSLRFFMDFAAGAL